jgi:hypothetical protein
MNPLLALGMGIGKSLDPDSGTTEQHIIMKLI